MLSYDPRVNRKIETDNSALILADNMIKSKLIDTNDPVFWKNIIKLANYDDMEIKSKIWFDLKHRRIKKNRLTFHWPKY